MSTMMTFNQIFSIVIAITIAIFSTSTSLIIVEAKNVGFKVDLIHRDSPKSPFYNHSLTPSQRVANALRRSVQWYDYIKVPGSVDIIPDHGEYLMRLSIGTPPVETLAIVDTGSDLTWIQCEPCINCFMQKGPIFNPKKSSSYKEIPCTSSLCHDAPGTYCKATSDTCQYSVHYHDKSFSYGNLAIETVKLVSTKEILEFPDIVFGCGHNNDVGPSGDNTNGIVGFGFGRESFISQALASINYFTFAYCLVPFSSTNSGKLYLGESNEFPSTHGAVSTRLHLRGTVYIVSLIGITVGNKRIAVPIPPSSSPLFEKGNMIIDSGTTLTYLPLNVYNRVESAVKNYVTLWPVDGPKPVVLKLCYKTLQLAYFPSITMNFRGADLELNPSNAFVKMRNVTCFAFSPGGKRAVLGNLAQMNLFISFDLESQLVLFKPLDCEKV